MERQRLHICYVATGLLGGGAEQQVLTLADAAARRGWRVSVVSMLSIDQGLLCDSRADVRFFSLKLKAGMPDPRGCFRLSRVWRLAQPHVVHSHMIHANLLARVTRLLTPVPVLISTAHSTLEIGHFFATERASHLAYRLTDFLADATTQVSRAGARRFVEGKAVPAHKMHYIPNAIDTSRFLPSRNAREAARRSLPWPPSSFLWLGVGRMAEAKGYPILLKAFARLSSSHCEACLVLVGDGPARQDLERLAAELKIKDKVAFLGWRRDIPELMNGADALVISSLYEGLPMVLLEAQATGLPAVATSVGGIPEVLEPAESGFVVPPGAVDALADAMEKMMRLSREARLEMGRRGRKFVEAEFGVDAVLQKWETLYAALLRKRVTT